MERAILTFEAAVRLHSSKARVCRMPWDKFTMQVRSQIVVNIKTKKTQNYARSMRSDASHVSPACTPWLCIDVR